jgi:hypothetical protein
MPFYYKFSYMSGPIRNLLHYFTEMRLLIAKALLLSKIIIALLKNIYDISMLLQRHIIIHCEKKK